MNSARQFIQYLIDKGIADHYQAEVLKSILQQRLLFGVVACRHGFITPDQLHDTIMEQADSEENILIGELMVRNGLLTQEQLDTILEAQKKEVEDDVPAELLLDTGVLPHEILRKELEGFLG